MFRTRSFFLFLAIISQSTAQAATAPGLPTTDEEQIVVLKKQKSQIYEDSSEANRLGKKYSLDVNLSGLSPGYAPGYGLTGGYFLNRNQLLLLEIHSGRSLQYSSSASYSNGTVKELRSYTEANQLGLHYKQFVGNSFYFRTGADYTLLNYHSEFFIGSSEVEPGSFSASALYANFTIGNQWQWENFNLGCDWFGVAAPVSYSMQSEHVPSDSHNNKFYSQDKEFFLSQTSYVLLRFYIGASF